MAGGRSLRPRSRRGVFTYRGRPLDAATLTAMRQIRRRHPAATRQELARRVCTRLRWRRPGGALAIRAATELLRRLERAGAITLPPPRRAPGRRAAAPLSPAAADAADTFGPPLAGTAPLHVRLVRPTERAAWLAGVAATSKAATTRPIATMKTPR